MGFALILFYSVLDQISFFLISHVWSPFFVFSVKCWNYDALPPEISWFCPFSAFIWIVTFFCL